MDNVYLLVFYGLITIFLLVTFFLILYIKNQNMVWKQRRLFQETEIKQQKLLLDAVIESQEIERKRIGEDLHDEIGGTLSAIKLMLGALKQAEIKDIIGPAKDLIDQMIIDVRNISHDLSPPGLSMFGFYHSLDAFVSLINKSEEINITITHEPLIEHRFLDEKTELALFRIITQLISNTIKHANASQIDILFKPTNESLHIHYTDNGKGFDPKVLEERKGIGMQNIQSRIQIINATHKLTTSPGAGFQISIDLNFKTNLPQMMGI
jgi:signal transduction histidine kinase